MPSFTIGDDACRAPVVTLPLDPVIVSENTGRPYIDNQFRRSWREIANACGVPRTIRNMDSRAGAISEATDAGADLHHVQHAATHSDIGMTLEVQPELGREDCLGAAGTGGLQAVE